MSIDSVLLSAHHNYLLFPPPFQFPWTFSLSLSLLLLLIHSSQRKRSGHPGKTHTSAKKGASEEGGREGIIPHCLRLVAYRTCVFLPPKTTISPAYLLFRECVYIYIYIDRYDLKTFRERYTLAGYTSPPVLNRIFRNGIEIFLFVLFYYFVE